MLPKKKYLPEKVLKFYVQKVQKTTLNNGVAKMQKKSLKTSSIKIILRNHFFNNKDNRRYAIF